MCFGATTSGRHGALKDFDEIVGLLISTIPVVVNADPGETVQEYLGAVQRTLVELREVDFVGLAEISRLAGRPAGEPVFDSVVVFENYPIDLTLASADGSVRLGDMSFHERSHYPLALQIEPSGDALNVSLGYDAGVVDGAWVEGLLRHLEAVLGEMAAAPDSRLGDVEMLTATERELVVDVWNETAVDYPEVGLMDRFDAAAMRDPHAVAVVCGDRTVTYGELQSAANRMARWLRQSGVGPDVLVGVCLGRSVELVVSVLAVLKAGGAYVPLDPSAPPARLGFMVTDAAMPVVVTDSASAEGLEVPPGTRVLRVDHDRDELAVLPDEGIECGAGPEHLAYVIYTSGSTGTPKGVLVPRRGIENRLSWQQAELKISDQDGVLQKASFGFDVSVWEILWPLTVGAVCVLAPTDLRLPDDVVDTVRLGATVVQFVPSVLESVLSDPSAAAALRKLSVIICGGDDSPASPSPPSSMH